VNQSGYFCLEETKFVRGRSASCLGLSDRRHDVFVPFLPTHKGPSGLVISTSRFVPDGREADGQKHLSPIQVSTDSLIFFVVRSKQAHLFWGRAKIIDR
jgi:hypothetical protein